MNTISILAAAAPAAITDCWNHIGVVGDQSCEKLATHVHCRNCPVYADAAQRNLQRPVDAGYRAAWASHLREPLVAQGSADMSALVFRIGRDWLALPTNMFLSVAAHAPSHMLPHRCAGGLLGIVNVGGRLYPSMSLATVLGIDDYEAPPQERRHTFARLLVMEWEAQAFVLPVADLRGIVRYPAGAVQAPPATINKGVVRFLAGVVQQGDLQVGCLDGALLGHRLTRLLR
jgi:chemotaxis-related protein WspD